MRANGALLALCVATLALIGCGQSSPGAASATPPVDLAGSAMPTGQDPEVELPTSIGDLERVCTTQVGFAGAAAYDGTPVIHPVALFYDFGEPPTLIDSSLTLPAGWAITNDANFEDNSEFALLELVACSRRTTATPNGILCDFAPSDGGDSTTLELTDTVFEMTVYEAMTGEQVGETTTLEASSTECPMIASFREGDTLYMTTPTEDQYVNALKEFVAP